MCSILLMRIGGNFEGSCGKAVDRMEIRIDSEDRNMWWRDTGSWCKCDARYYKNPEATAAFTEDGWMRTGDLGLIDNKGNVFINGRSKI